MAVKKFIKKAVRDLLLTLYDDFEFKCISLPRVWCAISGACVVSSWISEQYFGYKFSGFTQLVGWATACLGAYGVKKWVDKKRGSSCNEESGN